MPSLARVFLGAGETMKFKPNKSSDQDDVSEADQKTKYINWQIRGQKWSYRVLLGWLKDTEIQKTGVVKYFQEKTTEVEEHKMTGLSELEIAAHLEVLDGKNVEKVEISERGESDEAGRMDITFKVKKTRKSVKIINVPPERFILTRNAIDKDDAELVGDYELVTRGELLSRGFPKSKISDIPLHGGDRGNDESRLEDIRDADEGGAEERTTFSSWASEQVEVMDLYPLIDFDEDGIAERRHIIRGGDVILLNETFNHVPYAMSSAILMPHKAIGKSRAEITAPTARVKTAILRGINDNIYAVNNPQMGANQLVNMDDLLLKRPNGIVRVRGEANPGQSLFPITTPYIGGEALQVIQYWDGARAQTTGSLLPSQGLNADDLGKETATRFNGTDKSSKAKVELVARTIAETGWRQLFEGLAWVNRNFQDSETEIEVLGEELTVNPSEWKFDHSVVSNVGLGVGDDEMQLQTMGSLLQVSQQLSSTGSPLTDQVKLYNILDNIVKSSGLPDTSRFFNNPEEPDEMLKAENEILNNLVVQLQGQLQQVQNPLAEAERIKQESNLLIAAAKQEEQKAKSQLDLAKFLEDQRQFNAKLIQDNRQFQESTATKLTELELKFNQDVPGSKA
jgi:hypothetical protein